VFISGMGMLTCQQFSEVPLKPSIPVEAYIELLMLTVGAKIVVLEDCKVGIR
jgi:hypothetical protein